MTSRSEPNCRRREGMRILDSAPGAGGGSILEALRPATNDDDDDDVDAEVAVVLSGGLSVADGSIPIPLPRGGVCNRSDGDDPDMGSSPKSAEMELTRDRDAISGDVGGAKPVTQSITSTREGRGVEEALLLGDGSMGRAPVSSSRVAFLFIKSSVKWMDVYE